MEEKKQIKDKVILHSDVNNFYASVECSYHPELRDKPVAVTGNPEKRTGIILAKNEIAKKFGIKTGQVIGEAKALCPELVCLAPHYELYEEISTALHNLYLEYTNFVEPLGLDECWLDVTGSINYLKKSGVEIADEIREIVKKEFGLTVSVGVSFSKIFAKLGSDLKKPDFTTIISYDDYKKITYGLPLNSIVGIGRRLEKKFTSIDVNTIGDFVKLDDEYLNRLMGIVGINLKKDLLAERDVEVCDYYKLPPPKSIGNGTTTTKDIISREDIKKVIYFLAEKVSFRMLKHNVFASTLSLTIKDNNLKTVHKSSKILPTNEIKSLSKNALAIADKIWKYNRPVRAIRLRASSLTSANVKQLSMFDEKDDFSFALKEINQKYGKIELASDMENYLNKQSHFQK
mgnify:CR=1 FL=1